jgi:hypothetical protein
MDTDEQRGCLVLVAIVAISGGVGTLTEEAWGWVVFGCLLLLLLLATHLWKHS